MTTTMTRKAIRTDGSHTGYAEDSRSSCGREWLVIAVLALQAVALSCDDSEPSDNSRRASDRSPTENPGFSSGDGGPTTAAGTPPLNRLEEKVIAALGTIGVPAEPAQLSPASAQIGALLPDGSELYVNAYPVEPTGQEFTVLGERQVGEVTIRTIQFPASGRRERFECQQITYETYGALPPNFADFDTFVLNLLSALECPP